MSVLGFEDHFALAFHLALVGAHQAIAGGRWFDLVPVGGCGAVFQALFDQALGFDDLATFELAVFVGLLQQVAQVGLAVFPGGVGVLVGARAISSAVVSGMVPRCTPSIRRSSPWSSWKTMSR